MTPLIDSLRSLLPPVAYDPYALRLSASLVAEANQLQAVIDGAARVSYAMHPSTADADALAMWEHLLGLVPAMSATLEQRKQGVQAKLGELGGLDRAYFIRLAAAQGYIVTITEPRPFRAGVGRCGDRLYGEAIVFVWMVHIEQRPPGGDDEALMAQFNDLKPAHTQCLFLD